MTIINRQIKIETKGKNDIVDLTSDISSNVKDSHVISGIVTIFISGSTAAITTIEYEPNLIADFKKFWARIVPLNIQYQHDSTWPEGNGHSHIRASLLGASLTVPFQNKNLVLGTWQQIVLVDFDIRPRSREVTVQIMGE